MIEKKVYLLTQGEYSDYCILAVYDNQALASEAAALLAGAEVKEYEITNSLPKHPPGLKLWHVWMNKDGRAAEPRQGDAEWETLAKEYSRASFNHTRSRDGAVFSGWDFTLWARDQQHAIKIASERRRQMLASGEWEVTWEEFVSKRV